MPMTAAELARALNAALVGPDVEVSGIAVDSRGLCPGDLFVAQRGARSDGARFVAAARQAGAVAACAASAIPGLPTIVVPDPGVAAPLLAAAFFRYPARELTLLGITGTLGKTSTALLVESALAASGLTIGVIGSLGIRIADRMTDTGMTTPDAPAIHRALRAMADAGLRMAAMEVTSHGIAQRRVAGLTFALGVFTNLVPDEHLDFHRTPEEYVRTKSRFFDMLEDGAPLVLNADDERVRARAVLALKRRQRPVIGVSAEGASDASVRVTGLRSDAAGSAFALEIGAVLPRLDGGRVERGSLPLVLPVFGRHQVGNAALAATAALVAGASPEAITEAVAEQAPIPRRMEIVRSESPVVLDDTVGNPRTLAAVFDSIAVIPHRRLRVVFAIRGSRGVEINRRLGSALADLVKGRSREVPVRLVVTASIDTAGSRDRVGGTESEAMLAPLRAAAVAFEYEATLAAAVRRGLEGCGPGDLVLLLGAQGMDRAAELALALLPGGSGRGYPQYSSS
ncbi:MAG TPA: Mur ligase family protein [Gemmatimonadales bacterium]|nr:Mur ligase family protein [Gemmatimonadales bacterium]